LGRLLRHRQLELYRRVVKIASHPCSVNAHRKEKLPAQQAFHGPFIAFPKIDDPILLALSAVVSKGQTQGRRRAPDKALRSPMQILIFPTKGEAI